jgi:single-strand DNA-binding protein
MASDINQVFLIGRLTKDVELRTTQSGTQVASFSLAVNYTYGSGDQKKETVSFFNCTAWGKLGELINQYCSKGHRIAVTGRLQQQTWEKDGAKHSDVKVIVESCQFLQPREAGSIPSDQPPPADYNTPFLPVDDDIPF